MAAAGDDAAAAAAVAMDAAAGPGEEIDEEEEEEEEEESGSEASLGSDAFDEEDEDASEYGESDGSYGDSDSEGAPVLNGVTFVLPEPPRRWEAATHVQHQQCADALAPAGGTLVILGRARRLALFDAATGAVLAQSPRTSFDVYGISVDAANGWVVAAGNEHEVERVNVGVLHIRRPSEEEPTWGLEALREFGVGRVRRASREQANSVRFGVSRQQAAPLEPSAAAGAASAPVRVLLVGSQDRCVYVYPAPFLGPDGQLPKGEPRPLATHRFPTAVNCAAASPDGRWLAVTGDREEIYVTGSDDGFLGALPHATLRLTRRARDVEVPAGCQYVAWSADSARLAASSDTLFAVAVWAAPLPAAGEASAAPAEPQFAQLARFSEHARPTLPLCFLPPAAEGGPHLLAWAEAERHVCVADVDAAAARGRNAWRRPLRAPMGAAFLRAHGVQRLRLPQPAPLLLPHDPAQQLLMPAQMLQDAMDAHRRRITGLCAVEGGRLLVALPESIFQFSLLQCWSKERHALFPVAFRAAVRTLLCIAARPAPAGEEGRCLSDLPKDVLMLIISLAARPQAAWLTEAGLGWDEALLNMDHFGVMLDSELDDEAEEEEDADEGLPSDSDM